MTEGFDDFKVTYGLEVSRVFTTRTFITTSRWTRWRRHAEEVKRLEEVEVKGSWLEGDWLRSWGWSTGFGQQRFDGFVRIRISIYLPPISFNIQIWVRYIICTMTGLSLNLKCSLPTVHSQNVWMGSISWFWVFSQLSDFSSLQLDTPIIPSDTYSTVQ